MPVVSIIICTANRAKDLTQTLDALRDVCVPADLPCELLLVDNGSTDDTARVVQQCRLPHMTVRYVFEGRRGKGYAYNRGMAEAQGQVFLFTDDDVRPPADWIVGLGEPVLSGQADAVAGGVRIAPQLLRPWMEGIQRLCLASTDDIKPDANDRLIGANMALSRNVLARVPAFDTELGPGALGFGDESLFALQLHSAGYRIVTALNTAVEHHFDPSRLSRASLLPAMQKHGRSNAYIAYHWKHEAHPEARREMIKLTVRAAAQRVRRGNKPLPAEGMASWEVFQVMNYQFYKQYLLESKRPRNYEKHGLVKRIL